GKYTRAQTASLGPELTASFLGADLSVYVNMDVVNETHREDIRNFKELLEFGIKQAEMGDGVPGLDKKQLAAAKVVLATLFQGIEDCRGVVLAAEFRPEGLNLRAQARFADDSPTSRLLKTETPTPLADVGRLPGGMTLYSGMRFGPKVGPLGRSLVQPFQAPAGDDAGAALIENPQPETAAAGPGAELAASSIDAGLNVSTYASPEKAAAAQAKLYKGLASGGTIDNV